MSVSEIPMALGQWSITLAANTPRSILDQLAYFGHVAIATRRSECAAQGDSLLTAARYIGVVRSVTRADETQPITVSGVSMAEWLGDEEDKGAVYQTPLTLTAATFASGITALLPTSGSVTAGTISSVAGAVTQTFQWTSPRTAITQWCSLFSSGALPSQTVEWRVNGTGTLDAGPVSSLYVTTPVATMIRRNPGTDMTVRALSGSFQNAGDASEYTTEVVLLAAGTSGSTAVGTASVGSVPYLDIHGNPVQMVRMVSQSTTDPTSATTAAQTALAQYSSPSNSLVLSTADFDVKGVISAGDYIWVYNPDAGLVDLTQELALRGDRINPIAMRVVELDWPVTAGMGAAYRDKTGAWTDLSDYLVPETGAANVVVGALSSSLQSSGEPVGSRPIADPSMPGVPVFGAFTTASYVGKSDGKNKSQIQATWSTPLNTDGSTIVDGDHYEVQYRPDIGIYATNPSYAQLNTAGYTYNALAALGGSYASIIPAAVAQWETTMVGWGTNTVLIQELTPGVQYDFQIRAVDTATPPNFGAWSATTTVQAASDTVAPQTPDAPTVAANLLSVLVTWDCGSASGGSFNQPADLHHIEVHGSYEPLFAPTAATKLGLLPATIANINGQIPVVGSFTIPPAQPTAQAMFIKVIAVDISGNKSNPSTAAGATATLITDAYVTNISVSKLTAGTITASVILGSTISTSASGGRVTLDGTLDAFEVYDTTGTLTGSWTPAGFTLYTNPGGGSLFVGPNPGTSKSPSITFSAGVAGITATPGSIHSNAASPVEALIVAGPVSTVDSTLNSFARVGLYSSPDSLGDAFGRLEYWQNGTASNAELNWGQYGTDLTHYVASMAGYITGAVPCLDTTSIGGAPGSVVHYGVYSGTSSAGLLTIPHLASFTPVGGIATLGSCGASQIQFNSADATNVHLSVWVPAGTVYSGTVIVYLQLFG